MRVEHQSTVEARPDRVWDVLCDVERWPEWTPTMRQVRQVEGEGFMEGAGFEVRQPGQPARIWRVRSIRPGGFAWEAEGRLGTLRATHRLEADGDRTRNDVSLEADGMLAVLLLPLRPMLRAALRREARGLQQACAGRMLERVRADAPG